MTRLSVALCVVLCISACSSQPARDAGRPVSQSPSSLPADPVPRKEPRSRYGNGPVYEVLGKRYQVLPSSYGYREQGVASWYGRKFHGRPTSSQE
ncbi:MAG: septal ring lytic transglycosylase RlpA family lipoprotein, partial [Pseudomonadota bacterium]